MAADAMDHRRAGRTDRYMTGDAGDQFKVREHIHRAGYRSPTDFEAFLMTASQMIDDERIWSIVRGLAERLLTNIAITEEELATFRATVPSTTDVVWKHLDTVVDFMRQQAVQKGTSL